MKGKLLGLVLVGLLLVMAGCGGGHDERPVIETTIPSDVAVDADILNSRGVLTVTPASTVNGVFAGVDPNPTKDDVYRAFLHFPLATVPLNARIRSADLSIVIKSLTVLPPATTVPIRIELVSFTPPVEATDFNQLLPLQSVSIFPPISSADVNREVVVDVTPLMVEAQIRGLRFFQVRIFQENDLTTPVPGLVEIDEETKVNAPLLTVVYD
ncbi:lipoprotein, putative [Citrifermentans bemidjiense Bem]|uniref:Lipoprotein, putative n=1 Tax=Citrifermentans bemidjiense (strain ATCC BAA-1014 / DSM 16622 / JCM 12645 / Bem) TaxID=404380 RepID=B5E9Y5_CITBB|nr:lipoprotein [Citrifermentans bemidjiense]ACH37283.1 lipoprotein, putative [Citrifermentans bemidjiense Bem]